MDGITPGQTSEFFKAYYREFRDDPLPSRAEFGRFHAGRAEGRGTSYLAARPETASREVQHRWSADLNVYRLARVRVKVKKVTDLTSPSVQKRYGINRDLLVGDEYAPCQELAKRLRSEGAEAVWTYSRADQPHGRVLVLFLDSLRRGSKVEIVKDQPLVE